MNESLDLGNLECIVDSMKCTKKLPHGCPNCEGLDFCLKADGKKTLMKLKGGMYPATGYSGGFYLGGETDDAPEPLLKPPITVPPFDPLKPIKVNKPRGGA